MKRWGAAENELHAATRDAQTTFARALADDADLPNALQALVKLSTRLRQHVLEAATARRAVVPEPTSAAGAWLSTTLRDLGLPRTAAAWGSSAATDASETASAPGGADALDALVSFRAGVRGAALNARDDDAKLALRGEVLRACDVVRDADVFASRDLQLVGRRRGMLAF